MPRFGGVNTSFSNAGDGSHDCCTEKRGLGQGSQNRKIKYPPSYGKRGNGQKESAAIKITKIADYFNVDKGPFFAD